MKDSPENCLTDDSDHQVLDFPDEFARTVSHIQAKSAEPKKAGTPAVTTKEFRPVLDAYVALTVK